MTISSWTEAHQREAMRWLCAEIGALEGHHLPVTIRRRDIASEQGFRRFIVREIDIDGQDTAVRRVRGLAEGRLVRETVWEVRTTSGAVLERSAERLAVHVPSAHLVRVTRIRRAP